MSILKITGTLIWYYHICKREVWLMSHGLIPYQQDDFLILGRFLSEDTYKREKRELQIEGAIFDLVKARDEYVLIGEIKKSSNYLEAAKMQIAFYLKILHEKGIENVKGTIFVPEEKKKIEVRLDQQIINNLEIVQREILLIFTKPFPPAPKK